jgi:DNA modification methylase
MRLIKGDCLEEMKGIADSSVDMVLCDLPYGTTACKWDSVIPFEPLWEQYKRIIKKNGAIVLTASQPFTSALVMSNAANYKHHWVWVKERGTGFQVAKYRPMMATEDIIAFCNGQSFSSYNPQMVPLDKPRKEKFAGTRSDSSPIANMRQGERIVTERYPLNTIRIPRDKHKIHPTQKPVALMEYLIRTYTNEGDTVLDNTMGSGTTGVACVNTGREFIGIERDDAYFEIAKDRIEKAKMDKLEELDITAV